MLAHSMQQTMPRERALRGADCLGGEAAAKTQMQADQSAWLCSDDDDNEARVVCCSLPLAINTDWLNAKDRKARTVCVGVGVVWGREGEERDTLVMR